MYNWFWVLPAYLLQQRHKYSVNSKECLDCVFRKSILFLKTEKTNLIIIRAFMFLQCFNSSSFSLYKKGPIVQSVFMYICEYFLCPQSKHHTFNHTTSLKYKYTPMILSFWTWGHELMPAQIKQWIQGKNWAVISVQKLKIHIYIEN